MKKKKQSHTASLGSRLTCAVALKANFLSRSYRKRRLEEEEGSLEEEGGGVNQQSMGMGPKKNTAQTPDVETPCSHTHTHTRTH